MDAKNDEPMCVSLFDRGVVAVAGPDARDLLQRLVTNDVEALGEGEARYAALLTPQGKIVTDFLVVATPEGFLLDSPAATAADLAKRLTMYRLRSKVTVEDRSAAWGVVAYRGERPAFAADTPADYADPRHERMWRRAILPRAAMPAADAAREAAYRAERIRAAVPEGGLDFAYGDTFPHEANLDHLHGVDFRKGCYVGQEVVSRVQHRGTARKRIVPARFEGTAPPVGAEIVAGEVAVGTMGSAIDGEGLATVRLDKLEEGREARAGGVTLRIGKPAWV